MFLQEKIKALEADRPEVGELKGRQKRIEELQKENNSLKLKENKSFELEKTYEEKMVNLKKENAVIQQNNFEVLKKISVLESAISKKEEKKEEQNAEREKLVKFNKFLQDDLNESVLE